MRPLILVIPFIALLAACGGDDHARTVESTLEPREDTPVNTRPAELPSRLVGVTLEARATATPAPATPQPTPPPPETSDRLTKRLLTLEDMPAGWSPLATQDSDDEDGLCDGYVEGHPKAIAEVGFSQSEFGPFFSQILNTFDASDADQYIDDFADELNRCPQWTDKDGYAWQAVALAFPKLGDETFAVRETATGIPLFGIAQTDIVIWRRGGTLSMMFYVALGPAGAVPSPLEDLAKKADAKLKSALP